ncbi:MAG: hypothetical protein GYA36_19435 [Veillonellaceae bacterium]|nr:hypothetical protein [Veillonellaceae bacterium]
MSLNYGESVGMSMSGTSEWIEMGVNMDGGRIITWIGDSTTTGTGDNVNWTGPYGSSTWGPVPPDTIPFIEEKEDPFVNSTNEILKILDQKAKEMMEQAGVGEKSPILGPNSTGVRRSAPAKELPVQAPPPKRRIDVED